MPIIEHVRPVLALPSEDSLYTPGLVRYKARSLFARTSPIIPRIKPIPQITIERMPNTSDVVAFGKAGSV